MSTVLWANRLANGVVTSDEADKYALYRHTKKLDRLCDQIGVARLSEVCDFTDFRFNVENLELPAGMNSTDEMMAQSGVWIEAPRACDMLRALIEKIREDQVRFGLLSDARADVLEELEESLLFAEDAARKGASFNFSVVI